MVGSRQPSQSILVMNLSSVIKQITIVPVCGIRFTSISMQTMDTEIIPLSIDRRLPLAVLCVILIVQRYVDDILQGQEFELRFYGISFRINFLI